MGEPDRDVGLNAEVQSLLRHATLAGLKQDVFELAELFASLDEDERERLTVLLFGCGER
ncbi:hypothetical protein [Bradyrhizobium sp. UFLA05-112]